MSNFYRDNSDVRETFLAFDPGELAGVFEEGFRFAAEYPFAPKDAAEAVDNYLRALDLAGAIAGERIAATAEETDRVGNVLNPDGSVTYAPGIALAMRLYGEAGLLGVSIPYRLGGLNMPSMALTAMNDMVSRADASLMNLFGLQGIAETINMFGSEEQKSRYVPRLVSGELTGAMALTEPDAGSDLQSVKTAAFQDEAGNWFVSGVKRFITNGCGDVLLVLARTEPGSADGRGLSCLLVEKGPGVRVRRLEHKLGINGSPTCEIVFNRAPAQLIGQRKRGLITYVMTLMNGARLGIAAQGVGIGEAAYRAARAYAADRRQFGQTIDGFPALREILSDLSVEVQAARALTYYCARCVDLEQGLTRQFEALKGTEAAAAVRTRMKRYAALNKMITPMAKYYASEMSMRNANGAVAVLGGSGFMKDYPVERYLRDSRIATIYEGTSQLQVLAAVAGVTGGLVADAVAEALEGVAVPAEFASERAAIDALVAATAAAVERLKTASGGKAAHDLAARPLVDAGVAAVTAALLLRVAVKSGLKAKALVLRRFVARFPVVTAALAAAAAGDTLVVDEFEQLAPMPPPEN